MWSCAVTSFHDRGAQRLDQLLTNSHALTPAKIDATSSHVRVCGRGLPVVRPQMPATRKAQARPASTYFAAINDVPIALVRRAQKSIRKNGMI